MSNSPILRPPASALINGTATGQTLVWDGDNGYYAPNDDLTVVSGVTTVAELEVTGGATIPGDQILSNLVAGSNITFNGNEISASDTVYTAGNGLSLAGGEFKMSGSYTGTFTATGNITAFSDVRLKSDVETLDPLVAFHLRGVGYTKDDERDAGVIAQEIEQHAPELVFDTADGYKSVNYFGLIGYLIETVKYLHKEVEELKYGTS